MSGGTIGMIAEAQVREPKPSVGVYDLPCGYVDAAGQLHSEVQLRELSGLEEDLLANDKVSAAKKMNGLITNCIVRLGSLTDRSAIAAAVPDMLVGDRVFVLLAIRRTSVGDAYPYEDECPECKKKSLFSLDLSTLEVVKMKDPTKRIVDARLPGSAALKVWANTGEVPEAERKEPTGKTVRFRPITGKDEERASSVKGADAVSTLLGLRVELLDGKPASIADIQALSMNERAYLRDVIFRENDGGVDTTLDVECPACSAEFSKELDIGQSGFFFPSTARRRSKRTSST